MRPTLALMLLLILAACASPRTACLQRAAAPLRALDADIAETRAVLAYGYRPGRDRGISAGLAFCADGSPITLCLSGERPLAQRRVIAVDPAAERARLRALEARRPALAAAAARAAAICPAS